MELAFFVSNEAKEFYQIILFATGAVVWAFVLLCVLVTILQPICSALFDAVCRMYWKIVTYRNRRRTKKLMEDPAEQALRMRDAINKLASGIIETSDVSRVDYTWGKEEAVVDIALKLLERLPQRYPHDHFYPLDTKDKIPEFYNRSLPK